MQPLGPKALLFTDIEGSTALLQRTGPLYSDLLDAHHRIIRDSIGAHGCRQHESEGDSFFAIFDRPEDAVAAAVDAQMRLQAHSWPMGCDVRVRMGVHVGEIGRSEAGLIGLPLHEAARISDAAHGGQVLLSGVAAAAIHTGVDPLGAVAVRSLGDYDLKDVGRMTLVQLLHPQLHDVVAPPRTSGRSDNNLPTQLTTLVGRDNDIAEVRDLVDTHRLVSLLGSGGVGKTRLALAVANTLLDSFPDGVWFVPLGDVDDDDDVVTTILFTLGLKAADGPLQHLVDHLRPRQALVVLDNCEHLLAACSALAAALTTACPALHLLVTSQRPIGVAGEVCWRVPSLAQDDAVELFRRRAALVRADLAPGDPLTRRADDPVIRRICEHLDGIPLTIELAAARCRTLSLRDIETRLTDRFRLLKGGATDTLRRHQTLLATVEWSVGLLDPPERALLLRLAVFRGGADLDAVEAVCAAEDLATVDVVDVVDLVDSLNAKSLIQVDVTSGRTRVRCTETIRHYAAARLDDTGETDALTARHARFYAGLLHQAAVGWRSLTRVQWLRRCHLDSENLAAACDWLEEHDPNAAASMLGDAQVWLTAEDDPSWLDRLRRVSERADITPDRRAIVAALRALLAEGYGREGADVAHTCASCALEELDSVVDPYERLRALANIAIGLRAHDRVTAIALSERAVEESRHLGDAEATAGAMYDLILLRPEDDAATRALRTELIGMLDSNGARWWGITPLVDEALDAHQHGENERALACLDRAETIFAMVDLNDAVFTDEALTYTVWNTFIRAEQGDVENALLLSEDMLGRLGEKSPHQSKIVLSTYGHALWLAGDREAARRAFERAVDRADGWRFLVHAIATVGLAALEVDDGRVHVARRLVARVIDDERRQAWLRARAHEILARAALAGGDEELARHEVGLADALYRDGGYVVPPALAPAHEQLRRAVLAG